MRCSGCGVEGRGCTYSGRVECLFIVCLRIFVLFLWEFVVTIRQPSFNAVNIAAPLSRKYPPQIAKRGINISKYISLSLILIMNLLWYFPVSASVISASRWFNVGPDSVSFCCSKRAEGGRRKKEPKVTSVWTPAAFPALQTVPLHSSNGWNMRQTLSSHLRSDVHSARPLWGPEQSQNHSFTPLHHYCTICCSKLKLIIA